MIGTSSDYARKLAHRERARRHREATDALIRVVSAREKMVAEAAQCSQNEKLQDEQTNDACAQVAQDGRGID